MRMSRWRHAGLGLLVATLLLCACQARTAEPLVQARPIALQEGQPDRVRLDALRFEAGFVLSSADPRFGGLSGLWLAPDGSELIAVSDRGTIWRAGLRHAGDRLAEVANWSVVPLGRFAGERPSSNIDAEALADDGAGNLVIAVEGREPLRRIARSDPGAVPGQMPPGARLIKAGAKAGNDGIEALTALPDGGLLALSEGIVAAPGELAAWRIQDAAVQPLAYAARDGFAPTGADWLDDTVYVLERRFSFLDGGFASRILAIDVAQVSEGATLVGQQLAELRWPVISENFEGIAARRGTDGRVLLYLVSDDNFLPLQRTLLLQFSLAGP
jgi:hypothetical protein